MASASFSLGNWSVSVRGNHVYDRVAGPEHRLDVTIHAAGDVAARHLPHGLVGQSFSSATPRAGAIDAYPDAGRFTTTAMAEGATRRRGRGEGCGRPDLTPRAVRVGAIDGEPAHYEVPTAHATSFTFSRFASDEATRLDPALVAAADASARSEEAAAEAA